VPVARKKTVRRPGPAGFVLGLVLLALGAFALVSLATHNACEGPFPDVSARPGPGNACGVAGAYLSAYALALFGWAAYAVAFLPVLGGVLILARARPSQAAIRLVGLAVVACAATLGLAIANAASWSGPTLYRAAPGLGGGMLGVLAAGALYGLIGSWGTLILLVFLGCVGAFLLAGAELAWAWHALVRLGRGVIPKPGRRTRERKPVPSLAGEGVPEPADVPDVAAAALPQDEPAGEAELLEAEPDEDAAPAGQGASDFEVVTGYEGLAENGEEGDLDLYEKIEPEGEYRLPPITLLEQRPPAATVEDEAEIREKGRILQRTLGEFRVQAQVVGVRRGPVITMYELSLSPGTKVSKVESLSDDLAIALKAPNVRIVAPLPGRNTIGVEVPNTDRDLVGIRELMEESGRKAAGMAIPLFLGKDTAGNPLVLDLAHCPHLLVAGATGSGKSVAINGMICSILMTRRPDEVQFLLVDPKSVEFSQYAQVPHLICPVLSDMKKAASVLKWACKKMDERYSLLSAVGARDLTTYNSLGEKEIRRRLDPDGEADLEDVPFHMPHIVIIVDEFGELMMVAAKEVESSVIRLSQKARAVGIHLICATQRPSVDVITGLIKSNLPARIAFQVASKVDSRTILDRNGAELLLGRGDMLLLPPGTSRLIRAQGSFVSEQEVARVVKFLESQARPQFKAELREYHAREGSAAESDELYDEAVRVVLENQRGSVSLLQRRLSIGYSRAARLIDMMAEAGIVGPYAGSQAREVQMTLEEWERARQKN